MPKLIPFTVCRLIDVRSAEYVIAAKLNKIVQQSILSAETESLNASENKKTIVLSETAYNPVDNGKPIITMYLKDCFAVLVNFVLDST